MVRSLLVCLAVAALGAACDQNQDIGSNQDAGNPVDAAGAGDLAGPGHDLSTTSPDLSPSSPDLSPSPPDMASPPPDMATPVPEFVAAGPATLITNGTSLALATPTGVQENDLLLALVNSAEESGDRTLTAPADWILVGGFPIHNHANAHPPYIIPAIENHGVWVYYRIAKAGEPATHGFTFASATTARGVLLAYRGVDTAAPIHDKSALPYYSTGSTNGLGGGNTTLDSGRQVNLIATAMTNHATYTVVQSSPSIRERFNSGEQPNGLNLIAHDSKLFSNIYLGPSIANKQSPSGSGDGFCFVPTTLVLAPQ